MIYLSKHVMEKNVELITGLFKLAKVHYMTYKISQAETILLGIIVYKGFRLQNTIVLTGLIKGEMIKHIKHNLRYIGYNNRQVILTYN